MNGINRTTGKQIQGDAYLKDRIQSCLSMRIGTHSMRRLKGSRIPALIDAPTHSATVFEIQVAALDALSSPANGFSDLAVLRVVVDKVLAGSVQLTIVFRQKGIIKTLAGVIIQ